MIRPLLLLISVMLPTWCYALEPQPTQSVSIPCPDKTLAMLLSKQAADHYWHPSFSYGSVKFEYLLEGKAHSKEDFQAAVKQTLPTMQQTIKATVSHDNIPYALRNTFNYTCHYEVDAKQHIAINVTVSHLRLY